MLPKVPIVRLPDSLDLPLPQYADGVGTTMTLVAAISTPIKIAPGDFITVPTGFKCALPLGMEGQIRSLSSFSEENPIVVLNAPATIDASSRDEIRVTLQNMGHASILIRRGQPVATLVFSPVLRIQWNEKKTKKKTPKEDSVQIISMPEPIIEEPMPMEPEETVQTAVLEEYSPEEIKRIQDQADKELEQLDEIQIDNISNEHSDETFLDTHAPIKEEPVDMLPPQITKQEETVEMPPPLLTEDDMASGLELETQAEELFLPDVPEIIAQEMSLPDLPQILEEPPIPDVPEIIEETTIPDIPTIPAMEEAPIIPDVPEMEEEDVLVPHVPPTIPIPDEGDKS